MSKVSIEEMNAFFASAFHSDKDMIPEITHVETDHVVMRAKMSKFNLRPGGSISGPTQMALADHIAYALIFTRLGITPMAVTSNLNIDFLRPLFGDFVIIEGRTIKFGRTLAVTKVEIRAENSEKLSSQSTVTYVLPRADRQLN